MDQMIRLNKRLVELGLADSRRKADAMIFDQRVSVNGANVDDLGIKVSEADEILVDGKQGTAKSDIYIVYNKPRGQVCSHVGQGAVTIFDKLPKSFSSLKIAGRLDKDSEGLVILSSDGNFVNQLSHPSHNKEKTYIVKTKQPIDAPDIAKLNGGIKLEDGMSKMNVKSIDSQTVRIIMSEGKNRQIRRTLASIGKDVIKLSRIKINGYARPNLAVGEYEFIRPGDVL